LSVTSNIPKVNSLLLVSKNGDQIQLSDFTVVSYSLSFILI